MAVVLRFLHCLFVCLSFCIAIKMSVISFAFCDFEKVSSIFVFFKWSAVVEQMFCFSLPFFEKLPLFLRILLKKGYIFSLFFGVLLYMRIFVQF